MGGRQTSVPVKHTVRAGGPNFRGQRHFRVMRICLSSMHPEG